MGCGTITQSTGPASRSWTSMAIPFRLFIGKRCTRPSKEMAGSRGNGNSSKATISTGKWVFKFPLVQFSFLTFADIDSGHTLARRNTRGFLGRVQQGREALGLQGDTSPAGSGVKGNKWTTTSASKERVRFCLRHQILLHEGWPTSCENEGERRGQAVPLAKRCPRLQQWWGRWQRPWVVSFFFILVQLS